jgi:hypothetical protein
MFRHTGAGLLTLCAVLAAVPAEAQQTLNLTLGGFVVRGEDARIADDWLTTNRTYLTFDIDDFNGPTIGGEWLLPFGPFIEGGAGVAFSRRTVSSVYTDFVDVDGTEIEQDLRLRLVPVTFSVRVLPFGQRTAVQPYVGGGVGLFAWRYSESGEFIDFTRGNVIFREQYVGLGTAVGPVALGGLRFAGDIMSAGGEIRYHRADAGLGPEFTSGGLEPRIDLGGWSYFFTVGVRFGR